MNPSRRVALKTSGAFAVLVALGVVSQSQAQAAVDRAGFEAKTLGDALRALGSAPATSDQIALASPDVAENGAVVPVGVTSRLPNTTEIFVLVEKNPQPLAAAFFIPAGTAAEVQTRLKMSQSSNVVAVVRSGGRLFSATKETRVTLGGCG